MTRPSPTLTPALDGYRIWLGQEVLTTAHNDLEAAAVFRGAQALCTHACDLLDAVLGLHPPQEQA